MKPLNAIKLTLLLLALCVPGANAAPAEISGGLKTGLNLSNLVGGDASSDDETKATRAGLVIGGYLIIPVNLQFKVQAELLISQKGATYKWAIPGYAYEYRVNLTYLEIPVLARFDIKSRSGAKPAILVGPSFGIKMSARSESRTIGSSDRGNIEHIKALDPGVVLGGVVDIPAGKGAITLEARYTRSLVTISEKTGGRTPDIKNSAASILLGYRF